jgi:tRNA 2-thiouridine synthesizing protein A
MSPAYIADHDIYDLRGLNCPLPVLRARKRLAGMAPGARLWVETTDPLATIDIPAFCREEGYRLVESLAVAGGNRFLIERCG